MARAARVSAGSVKRRKRVAIEEEAEGRARPSKRAPERAPAGARRVVGVGVGAAM